MCRSCYSDPAWDAIEYRRQGAVDAEDFYKEVNYRPKKKKAKARSKVPGCPGNEGKAHIYVWTCETMPTDYLFYRYFGFHSTEWKVCAGCGKKNGSRKTEQYEARKEREYNKRYKPVIQRGEPVSRRGRYAPSSKYYQWENYDDGYAEYRRDYIKKHGYNSKVFGPSGWW